MFRIEYTNYTGAYTFKAIDNIKSMTHFRGEDGKVYIQVETDTEKIPHWVEYYPSDEFVIDIVPVQG